MANALNMYDLDVDLERGVRTGVSDIVNGSGRSIEQTTKALSALFDRDGFALGVQIDSKMATPLLKRFADSRYDARARAFAAGKRARSGRSCGVVHGSTADVPCADEVAFCLDAFGHDVVRVANLRLATPHAFVERLAPLVECAVTVVVAGMDAGIASAVAGNTRGAVVAVPTASGEGLMGVGALFAMLAAAHGGVTVTGIDCGFGAAIAAHKIAVLATPPAERRKRA